MNVEQLVEQLCARWRSEAAIMDGFAQSEEDPEALECIERAKTFRQCADELQLAQKRARSDALHR